MYGPSSTTRNSGGARPPALAQLRRRTLLDLLLYDDPFAYLQQLAGGAPNNWSGYASRAYDELLVKANASADPEERLRLFMEAERLIAADQPLIPIYYYHGKLLLSPRVQGWWDASIGTRPRAGCL